jgi:hypothetical protein
MNGDVSRRYKKDEQIKTLRLHGKRSEQRQPRCLATQKKKKINTLFKSSETERASSITEKGQRSRCEIKRVGSNFRGSAI